MATTFEQILNEVKSLSPEQRNRLAALLESQRRAEAGHKTVEQLIAEQGTRPLSFQELLGEPGALEDESIDEFLAELEQWRSQRSSRRVG